MLGSRCCFDARDTCRTGGREPIGERGLSGAADGRLAFGVSVGGNVDICSALPTVRGCGN
jgi:hypothetical protein